jgi:hypothetical protein
LQELVAGEMAKGIVDLLETIEIEKQQRDLFPVARRQCDGLANSIVQEHSIGQASEKVVRCQMGDLFCHSAGRAYIAKNDDRPRSLTFPIVDGRDRVFDGDFMPIAADEDRVWRKVHRLILSERHLYEVRNGFPSRGVQNVHDFHHGPSRSFVRYPACHLLCYGIDEGDDAGGVSTNHSIAD